MILTVEPAESRSAEELELADRWYDMTRPAGRNEFPAILFQRHAEGDLDDPDLLAYALESAWTLAEFPGRWFGEVFTDLFRRVGYLHDHHRAPERCPKHPVTLWRAATPEHKYGMSWTDDRAVAERFLQLRQYLSLPRPRLYRLEARPSQLLARFDSGRREAEYVVDVDWYSGRSWREGIAHGEGRPFRTGVVQEVTA